MKSTKYCKLFYLSPAKITNFSFSNLLTTQKEHNNSNPTFEKTDQIKSLINDRLDKDKTNAAIAEVLHLEE
jgi:hypothetical protein